MSDGVLPTAFFTRALLVAVVLLVAVLVTAQVRGWSMTRDTHRRVVGITVVLAALYVAIVFNERPQSSFDSLAWGGLLTGSILALAAIGLTLVYGILNLSNFSHGDLLTLGGYLAFLLAVDTTGPGALAAAIVLVVLASGAALVDRFALHKLTTGERNTLHATALVTLGALLGQIVDTPLDNFLIRLSRTLMLALFVLGLALGIAHALMRVLVDERPRWWPALPIGGVASAGIGLALMGNDGFVTYAFLSTILVGAAAAAFVALRRPRGDTVPLVLGVAGAFAALLYSRAFSPTTFLLSSVVAVAGVVVFVIVLDLLLWRRLRERRVSILTLLIVSIGVALALRHAIQLYFGGDIQAFGRPPLSPFRLGAVRYNVVEVFIVGTSAALILGTHLFLSLTRVGKAMRAMADNPDLARVSGINVDRIILYVWALAGSLAAVAGVLLTYWRSFTPLIGWNLLLPTFAAVILGGIGSAVGALAGAISLGLAMEMSSAWIETSYKNAIAFVVLIVLLLIRPQGIFGGKVQ